MGQEELVDELIQNAVLSADSVACLDYPTGAQRTRAIVKRTVESLIGNGLVSVTPRSEWPRWIVLDPPFQLPKGDIDE
jgi:hypothetical protein